MTTVFKSEHITELSTNVPFPYKSSSGFLFLVSIYDLFQGAVCLTDVNTLREFP